MRFWLVSELAWELLDPCLPLILARLGPKFCALLCSVFDLSFVPRYVLDFGHWGLG